MARMLATLTNEHIAFYSTAATAIPVLMLGSLLAVATFARSASRWLDGLANAIANQTRQQNSNLLREVRASRRTKRILEPVLRLQEFSIQLAFSGLGRRFVAPLLLLGFLIPVGGEVAALSALADGHGGHATDHAVWLGIGVSTILALVPILEVFILLVAPVDAIRRVLEKTHLRSYPLKGDSGAQADTVD